MAGWEDLVQAVQSWADARTSAYRKYLRPATKKRQYSILN